MTDIYDVVILGGGPAGLTAGIYAARARMKTLILEKYFCGGQILVTHHIENFPGFPQGIGGPELAEVMTKQADRFGAKVETEEALSITPKASPKDPFIIKLKSGKEVKALSVIVSTGARWNELGISGEKELLGRGVSYCGTCDGPLFRNKEVVVVGGGDTAIEDGLFLAKFATKVTIVHRRDRLRATKILQERALANPKITLKLNSIAQEVVGQTKVTGIKVKDVVSGVESVINCDGVFIFIGITPNSDIVKGLVKTGDGGYVISDDDMNTSVEGIYACGDVRKKTLRQVVTATGEGATAAFSAEHYVDRINGTEYK
jgi:thioredoxin reductase (NADPH)